MQEEREIVQNVSSKLKFKWRYNLNSMVLIEMLNISWWKVTNIEENNMKCFFPDKHGKPFSSEYHLY